MAPLDRAGPLGFPLPVAEIKLKLHGSLISRPVLSAIQAKTIELNAGAEGKWVGKAGKMSFGLNLDRHDMIESKAYGGTGRKHHRVEKKGKKAR